MPELDRTALSIRRPTFQAVREAEGHHVEALTGAIADAQQKLAAGG